MMSRVTIRNAILSTVFLLAMSAIFGYGLLVIRHADARLTEQVTALATNQAQEATLKQMQRTAEESAQDRQRLDQAFLADEGASIDFLNLVESLAREAGIALTTENLTKGTNPQTKQEQLIVDFTYSGMYQSAVGFLEVLENLPYLTEVTSFDLTQQLDGEWQVRTTLQIQLYTYEN